jgi:tellurite resistance protein TehA-like permease
MLRFYTPLVFIVLFVGWVLYRLLVKKDLKQNLNNLYLGIFFIAIWGLIYVLIFN